MKTVLITGASRGIGEAIAKKLNKSYNLVLTYNKNKDKALNLLEKLRKENSNVIAVKCLIQDMDFSSWNDIINTNLSSIFLTSKRAIPYMVSQKSGVIINMSSIWGNLGASFEVAYSASKGGINSFTKALSKALTIKY